MEKNSIAPRKTHYLRNKSKHDMETEETKSPTQRVLRDKSCQTDHHNHGCCASEKVLEPGDPPLLQQPVQTAKSGILQIIECFRSGTKQLRLMLLREVDTIFECKSCRSLFRGLPNLITHKQFYCLSKLQVDEDPPNGNNQSQVVKDLVESVCPRANNPEVVVQLEAIRTNQNAMFLVVKPANEANLSAGVPDSDIQEEESVAVSQPSLTPEAVISPSENTTTEDTSSFSNVDNPNPSSFVARSAKKASNSNPFLCRICKKDFNCRRSIRRHVKKVHKKKLEEIKKCIEVQRNTPLSSTKGLGSVIHSTGKSCHICQKSFATKANTRRHIDEVHRGMRRDYITESSAKPGKSMNPEIATPKKGVKTIPCAKISSTKSDFSLASSSCSICNRRYTSKYLLKKHMQIVHKTSQSENNTKSAEGHVAVTNGKVKLEDSSSSHSSTSSPQSESKGATMEKKCISAAKNKTKGDGGSPKNVSSPASDKKKYRKSKLSAGFDFKQLYCKLCKRQFTSKQNLAKHIELHTDGNCIFVKFYRCPLCSYETRRKRDVIRHITVVHKKTQRALIKITANLESRVIKKPIECIMDKTSKKHHKQEKGKKDTSKKDPSSTSSKKNDGGDAGIEVKVTKNFSLLKCKTCGKAFAKKKDLEQHKKNHKMISTNSTVGIKNKGRSTRSKASVS
ncbi:zinc finger protein 800 isoform X1 [Bufo bufo]|uniref:zinc finger protein 800 isoform X1 n=1 Tax=Bufo bufo TaxID=8384 RepID=UPI001ABE1A1F|nr:zinc finger protein 800 isoform X1 [Bufo bufo]